MKALYGRRKGKRLRAYHDGLTRELLPRLALDLTGGALAPPDAFSGPFESLELEIGFGDGARLAARAAAHPERAFIGCEPFLNGVAKALASIDSHGLENIRLHHGDARELIAALPLQALDAVEILYPDPWPKRRQLKRRLISDAFLAALAPKMKPGAPLRFATDIDSYCGWTLARILRSDDFVWPAREPAQWLEPWLDWTPTRYEEKARREGRSSAYLTFYKI